MNPRHFFLAVSFLVCLALGFLVCHIGAGPEGLRRSLTTAELATYDWRVGWLPLRDPDPRIALVAIDVPSLDEYGSMPWDRRLHARLIEKLAQAAVIAFDVSFSGSRKDDGEADRALAEAVRRSGKVVMARYLDVMQSFDPITGESTAVKRIHQMPEELLEALEGKRGIGLAYVDKDQDGGVRSSWMWVSSAEQGAAARSGSERVDYSPLSVAALLKLDPAKKFEIARGASGWEASYGDREVPVATHVPVLLLDFPGRPFPVYSYKDVLAGKVAPETFAGKLVVVGSTSDISDRFTVPRNPAGKEGPVPGCFVHAVLADMLLSGQFLRVFTPPWEPPGGQLWLSGWTLGALLCFVSAMMHLRLPFAQALRMSLLLGVAYFVATYVALLAARVYVNQMVPLAMLVGFQCLPVLYEIARGRQVLGRFVPQEHVEGLLRSEAQHQASHSQVATVLFVDIRDYTTLSEKLEDPMKVREVVSQFHNATAEVFEKYSGYVCDFQGDAQMVAFGVAPRGKDHAELALQAAAALPEAVARLNAELAQKYPQLGPFRFGVGICTGEVSVGYLKGGGKLQHTVLGDTTNTAARLQGLARDLGVITVVSHTAVRLCPGWAERLRALPPAKLKGKAEAHDIFELV